MRTARNTLLTAILGTLIPAAGAAPSQTAAPLPRPLRTVADPIVARLNGTRAPNMLIGVGLDHADSIMVNNNSPLALSRSELTIGITGVHSTLRLGGLGQSNYDATFVRFFINVERPTLSISIPMETSGANITFLPSADPAARVFVVFQMPDADLYTSVTLHSGVVPGLLITDTPGVAEYELQETVLAHAHGLSGAGTFRIESQPQPNNAPPRLGLVAESFVVQCGSIEVFDSAGVAQFTSLFLKTIDDLFGTNGASDVQSAMRLVVNTALNNESGIKPFITSQLNAALTGAAPIAGQAATVAVSSGMQLSFQALLASASSSTAELTAKFNVATAPTGTIVNPTLPYAPISRPVENIATIARHGDMQVFAPFSLADEIGYDMAVMGMFNRSVRVPLPARLQTSLPMPVPPRDVAIGIVPTGAPLTQVNVLRPGELVWSMPVQLITEGQPGTGTLQVRLVPQVSAAGVLELDPVGGQILDPSGSVGVAGFRFPLTAFVGSLNPMIDTIIRAVPPIPMVSNLTDPQTGVITSIADVQVSGRSIQVAINFDRPAPPPMLMPLH